MKLKSLYLHFPFCRHLCNYCDFHKAVLENSSDIEEFNQRLTLAFAKHDKFLMQNNHSLNSLETFYMGGGTPSLWGKSGFELLNKMFKQYDIFKEDEREFTLEVNPGAWTKEGLESAMHFGVNRFSLGVQSLDSRFLKYLDRIHSLEEVHKTLSYFNRRKLSFSVDFMLGLPFSKSYDRDIIFELEEILKYDPEHLSLYILTTKSNYIHKEYLPDDEWISDEFMKISNYLTNKGYKHYEVSNFSKSGKESKHNLMYWKSSGVAALGPSATGFLPESKIRYKWKNLTEEMVIEKLTDDEINLEKFYMLLRTNQGLPVNSKLPYFKNLKKVAPSWIEKGYGEIIDDSFITAPKGFLMIDSMMNDIFL